MVPSIELTSLPDKLTYIIGEEYDNSGLEVTAVFSDESRIVLSDSEYELYTDDFDSSSAGTYTIYVEYDFEEASFDVTVSENTTPQQYTITFDTDGGNTIMPITQEVGTSVTTPANPTKEGFVFVGWDKPVPTIMPSENITITALWDEQIDISSGQLVIDPITFNYTGKQKTISEVIVTVGNVILTEDDYDIYGNTGTNAGIYTLTVTGKGRYKGSLSAQWKISRMYKVTATINGVTTSTMYEDKATATFTSSGQGGWFINGVLRSIRNKLAFTVLENTIVEWRTGDYGSGAIVNTFVSNRKIRSDGKTEVIITGTWSVHEGATISEVGIARMYVDIGDEIPDKTFVKSNGTNAPSQATAENGTYLYTLIMGTISSSRVLCAVTYVVYNANGSEHCSISEVVTSSPQ